MPKTYTPMMQHYLSIKEQYPDAIVFYRLGDFYEMFFDDARTASRELDLVLTGKNAGVDGYNQLVADVGEEKAEEIISKAAGNYIGLMMKLKMFEQIGRAHV